MHLVAMSTETAWLLKILKDETRRKIILLLHESNTLAYSDLLAALKTQDRGRLNYHLKSLAPLLNKNDTGYTLNEQGMLVWKMLQEFSYAQKSRLATIIKLGRNGVALGLVIIFFLSYYQHLSVLWLLGATVAFSILTIALVVLVKVQNNKLSSCRSTDCIDTSLHEILTDETRRKIVSLLRENGTLSYSELMKAAQVNSNGQMNYHLKVIGDVISSDGKGQYSLTEKGVFAYTSLHSVQGKKSQSLLKINPLWQQWFGIALVSALMLAASFLMYSRGTFVFETVVLHVANVVLASSALFYLSKVNDDLKLEKVKNTRVFKSYRA
jgi:DNA-binding transcriptional ArsR family regulator